MGEASPAQIRRLAMDYLARREHGKAELMQKLEQRGVDGEIASNIVRQLANEGLQDDERFSRMYTRAQAARGKGPLYVRNGLMQRGLTQDEAAASVAREQIDWAENAFEAALKKFSLSASKDNPSDYSVHAGRMRFLLQRGFSQEQASRALRRLKNS